MGWSMNMNGTGLKANCEANTFALYINRSRATDPPPPPKKKKKPKKQTTNRGNTDSYDSLITFILANTRRQECKTK